MSHTHEILPSGKPSHKSASTPHSTCGKTKTIDEFYLTVDERDWAYKFPRAKFNERRDTGAPSEIFQNKVLPLQRETMTFRHLKNGQDK